MDAFIFIGRYRGLLLDPNASPIHPVRNYNMRIRGKNILLPGNKRYF